MAIDSILDSLPTKLAVVPTAQALQPIIDQLAASANDSGMRSRVAAMAAAQNRSPIDDRVLNVMAAATLGVLPGGESLKPVLEPFQYGWRVNSFLSALRHAMVNSRPLRATLKMRASQFIFYPEFYYEFPDSMDQRIAAIARAHAGMTPKSTDLPALYTLGGLFDGASALNHLKEMGGGGKGTTCVMTARGIYHAAGCDMIDGGELTINTPNGPVVDLGTPTKKTKIDDKGKAKTVWTAHKIRADLADDGKAFQDNNRDIRPHLTIGDIYYVEGTGDHLYLARGNGALAVHVGIIVGHSGDTYYTVDGGGNTGADVTLSPLRKMTFKDGGGWCFAEQNIKGTWGYDKATRSYNNKEVGIINAAGAELGSDEAIRARIKSDKGFSGFHKGFEAAHKAYTAAVGTPNEKKYEKELNVQRENVRRLARIVAGGRAGVGEVRTIHGWWESESYDQLAWAGPKQIAELMR